jgi:hypothetical protein
VALLAALTSPIGSAEVASFAGHTPLPQPATHEPTAQILMEEKDEL